MINLKPPKYLKQFRGEWIDTRTQRIPILYQGQELICQDCHKLIAVMARDVYSGDHIEETMFISDHLKDGYAMICQHCHIWFHPNQFIEEDRKQF